MKDEGGVYIRCPNADCPAQLKERIRYFATPQRHGYRRPGRQAGRADWSTTGLVSGYGDLYRLTPDKLHGPGADGAKSRPRNCWPRIEASKRAGWRGCSTRCRFGTSARGWRRCWPSISARSSELQQAGVEELAEMPKSGR